MAVYRRIFRQGNSIVFAVPSYMVEALGVGLGDYFLVEQVPGPAIKLTGASVQSVVAIFKTEAGAEARRRAGSGGGGGGGRARSGSSADGAQSEGQDP